MGQVLCGLNTSWLIEAFGTDSLASVRTSKVNGALMIGILTRTELQIGTEALEVVVVGLYK